MGQINNLNDGNFPDFLRRLKALETATPMNNGSIGRGGLRVYGGGGITIENEGGLRVTGTAEIIGRLLATGIIDFEGEVNISGPLVVEDGGSVTIGSIEFQPDGSAKFGTLTIDPEGKITTGTAEINPDGSAKFGEFTIASNGDLTSAGTLDIEGVTTLKADLNVTTGKITAGAVSIDPGHLSGSVKFTNGTYVAATPNGAQLVKPGGGAVTVSAGQADMSVTGGGGVIVDGVGVSLQGLPTTTNPPNLYISPGNRLYRSTV